METIYICILTLLGVFAMMLWLVFHFNRVQQGLEEEVQSVKHSLDGVRTRIVQMDEAQKKLQACSAPETGDAQSVSGNEALTIEGIVEAVRATGYTMRRDGDSVAFIKDGDRYVIEAGTEPRIFIRKGYRVDPAEWDLDVMKKAAYRMSDDIIMVKAHFSDETDEDGAIHLTFFLAVMDRTLRGFRENLPEYIDIIDQGKQRLGEFYDQLVKDKTDSATLNGLAASSSHNQNGKTPS